MGKSPHIKGKFSTYTGSLSPECTDRVVAFLRKQHPIKTAQEVEYATAGRVQAAAVKKWLAHLSAPSFLSCLSLIAAYGPAFLHAIMDQPPEWISYAAQVEKKTFLEAERARINAQLDQLASL